MGVSAGGGATEGEIISKGNAYGADTGSAKGLMFMTNKEVTKIIFEQFWYLNKCGFREAWSWSDLHGIRKIYEIENNYDKLTRKRAKGIVQKEKKAQKEQRKQEKQQQKEKNNEAIMSAYKAGIMKGLIYALNKLCEELPPAANQPSAANLLANQLEKGRYKPPPEGIEPDTRLTQLATAINNAKDCTNTAPDTIAKPLEERNKIISKIEKSAGEVAALEVSSLLVEDDGWSKFERKKIKQMANKAMKEVSGEMADVLRELWGKNREAAERTRETLNCNNMHFVANNSNENFIKFSGGGRNHQTTATKLQTIILSTSKEMSLVTL